MNHIYNCTGHDLIIPNIVDTQGIYVFDENGKQYMDLESGVWCTSIGHNNPMVNNVIKQQMDAIMHAGFCYSNDIVQEAAALILSITGFSDGKCVFLCSGSEAIEITRQIARHLTGKKISMTLHDSYLGSYSSATNREQGWSIFNWEDCKYCKKQKHCDVSCVLLQGIPKDVSEFIFEPGSSSGFVRFPPKALIQNIVRIIHENNGKVIANEVTTGIGRTGEWFGYNHYDIEPDMIAIGKGIGNGYPVSVAAINKNTIKELGANPFKYAQSHQNDPLGASIVRQVIEEIRGEDLISKAREKGAVFSAMLKSLVDNRSILKVRARGLMFALDLADENVGNEIFKELIKRGYIVCNRGALFRIDPPLIIDEAEFESFINTFKSILARINKVKL